MMDLFMLLPPTSALDVLRRCALQIYILLTYSDMVGGYAF